MVRIIDESREESVGKIEDTGSYSTDDDLLDSYLQDFVENGITTLVCDHSESGVVYNVGKVEPGDKNFSKAVIQHLPSPYYADEDELESIGDYTIVENQDEDKPALRGKQGAMESINRFTSLSSQSSPVTRERVEADWNTVIDEQNLPESAKNKSVCKVKKEDAEDFINGIYSSLSHSQLTDIDSLFKSINLDKTEYHLNKEFQKAIRSSSDNKDAFEDVIKRNQSNFSNEQLKKTAKKYGWEGDFFRKSSGPIRKITINTHNIDISKQNSNIPTEHREYVDSPDEVPEDARMSEGEREDTYYYDVREAEGEGEESDDDYMTRDELYDKAVERFGDLEGREQSNEAFDFVQENIMDASAEDLTDLIDEALQLEGDIRQDWFESVGQSSLHEYTKVQDNVSLNRPCRYKTERPRQDDIAEGFKQDVGESANNDVQSSFKTWADGDLYSEGTEPILDVAIERTGNTNINSREDIDASEIEANKESKENIEKFMEFDRDKIRERFGEQIPVYRGISANPSMWHDDDEVNYEDAKVAAETVDQGMDVQIEHGPVESWTTNPVEASRFADDDGIIIQDIVDVDEILASANSVEEFIPTQAEYLILHQGSETYEHGEDVFQAESTNPISLVQSAISRWEDMNDESEEKSKTDESIEPAATIGSDSTQLTWLSVLSDNLEYGKDIDKEYKRYDSRGVAYDIRLTKNFAKLNISKERIYVDSRSDVPAWADAEEGPQGGVYYEVGDEEGQARLGGIPPEQLEQEGKYTLYRPDDMDLDELSEGSTIYYEDLLGPKVGEIENIEDNRESDIIGRDSLKIEIVSEDGEEHSIFIHDGDEEEETEDMGYVVDVNETSETQDDGNDFPDSVQDTLPGTDDDDLADIYIEETLPDNQIDEPPKEYSKVISTLSKNGVSSNNIIDSLMQNRIDIDNNGSELDQYRDVQKSLVNTLQKNTERNLDWTEHSASYKSSNRFAEASGERLEGRNPEAYDKYKDDFRPALTWERYEDLAGYWQAAEEIAGHSTNKGFDMEEDQADVDPFDVDVDDEEEQNIQDIIEYNTEIVRELYGDEVLVYRGIGINKNENEELYDNISEDSTLEIEHQTLASWTTSPITAANYASSERNSTQGVVVSNKVDPEQIVASHFTNRGLTGSSELGIASPESNEYDLSEGGGFIADAIEIDAEDSWDQSQADLSDVLDEIRQRFMEDNNENNDDNKSDEETVHLSLNDHDPYWLTELNQQKEESDES